MTHNNGDTVLTQLRTSQILEAAIALVAENGSDKVRLRDISTSTGLSIGTLQHYFATRDNLLEAAFLEHHERVINSFTAAGASDRDPWQRICRMIDDFCRPESIAHRSKVWIEMVAQARREPAILEAASRAYETWRTVFESAIRDGIDLGQFQPVVSVEDATSAFLAAVDGYEIVFTLGIGNTTAESVNRSLKTLVAALLNFTEQRSPSPATAE